MIAVKSFDEWIKIQFLIPKLKVLNLLSNMIL